MSIWLYTSLYVAGVIFIDELDEPYVVCPYGWNDELDDGVGCIIIGDLVEELDGDTLDANRDELDEGVCLIEEEEEGVDTGAAEEDDEGVCLIKEEDEGVANIDEDEEPRAIAKLEEDPGGAMLDEDELEGVDTLSNIEYFSLLKS